jgi:hypothetical protein
MAGDLPKSRVVDHESISDSQQGAVVDHARGGPSQRRTIREVAVCSLRISIADVGLAADRRPADRREEMRDGNPTESGSFCQLTVTANSQ